MSILNYLKRIIKPLPKFAKMGDRCRITPNIIVNSADKVELGNNIYIGPYAILYSTVKRIIIKDNVIIGPRVTMMTADHNIHKIGVNIIDNNDLNPDMCADITIENDVWIGTNVTILKGVTIGRGAVVAAGAVVTHSVENYSIVAGVPAKKIGMRFNEQEIIEHEKILY